MVMGAYAKGISVLQPETAPKYTLHRHRHPPSVAEWYAKIDRRVTHETVWLWCIASTRIQRSRKSVRKRSLVCLDPVRQLLTGCVVPQLIRQRQASTQYFQQAFDVYAGEVVGVMPAGDRVGYLSGTPGRYGFSCFKRKRRSSRLGAQEYN